MLVALAVNWRHEVDTETDITLRQEYKNVVSGGIWEYNSLYLRFSMVSEEVFLRWHTWLIINPRSVYMI